ncbi:MAG: hypothetical protein ABR536_06300 [Solirubrobacterales bacterium]
MSLADRARRFFKDVEGPIHPDGIGELHVGEPKFDDWEVVRDFNDLETGRAFRQALTDQGLEAILTSDYEPDQHGRADIALRVPPGKWSEANELLDEP